MSDLVIQVDGLWKGYRRGVINHRSLSHDLQSWWARLRGKEDPNSEVGPALEGGESQEPGDGTFWALRDVSFEVRQGDILGLIGRNGAGKSTLLEILSQITAPTRGECRIRGRIASLLEVGTGFHPELTGRENIYLNGAILGMTKAEIQRKFDEIVDFSQIEKYIETPVKRYSSGMYVRLAFAVAAHLESEILLVDEVLAVGDAEFQKKCIGKMRNVVKDGRTVLFVSHNMAALHNLCPNSIWLDSGSLHSFGPTAQMIHSYLHVGPSLAGGEADLADWPNRYGNGEARIVFARLLDADSSPTTVVRRAAPMTVEFTVDSRSAHNLHLSAVVVADTGVKVLHLSHHDTKGLAIGVLRGKHLVRFTIDSVPLCAGSYHLILSVHTESLVPLDVVTDVLPFAAEDDARSSRPYKTIAEYGYCWVPSTWSVRNAG